MVIFRENTEDIYAGIEYAGGSPEAQKVLDFLSKEFPKEFKKVRFGTEFAVSSWQHAAGAKDGGKVEAGIGVKPISRAGPDRLIRSAVQYAIRHKRKRET